MEISSTDHMTVQEAIERLSDSKRPEDGELHSVTNSPSSTWDLNTDFNEARKLATEGWDDKAEKLSRYMVALERLTQSAPTTYWDYGGDAVDVGRFLEEEPECMINFNTPQLKTVSIVVNISARCSANAEYLFNRGIAVAAAVFSLQASGVAVSLKVGEWVSDENLGDAKHAHETMIEINKYGQYIDPAKLAFWLAHPAALRRCVFRYQEQQTSNIRRRYGFGMDPGGYGYPSDAGQSKVESEKGIFVPFPETETLEKYKTPAKAFEEIKALLAGQGIRLS